MFARFNFNRSLRGLIGMGTVAGTYYAARAKIVARTEVYDRRIQPIGRFDPNLRSIAGYDPLKVRYQAPLNQSSYVCNPMADIYANGHYYDYTSKSFTMGPGAMEVLNSAGQAAAIPMILSFAGGDGSLVRPESEKNNHATDFEYTKAVLRSGIFPPDCEVNLGKSRIMVSDVIITKSDSGFALSLRASTTSHHLFDGNARWELQVDKDGNARTNICGAGKAILFALDGANNCIAGTLWDTSADKLKSIADALEKDRDVIERSGDHTELRANVASHAELPRASQCQENLLRILNVASGPLVHLKAAVVAADLCVLKDGTTQNIRAFVNQYQLPKENDFISSVESDAITQSADQTPALDKPLMQKDDVKSFASPVSPEPTHSVDADVERKAREAREAEARREAEQREREKKEREERQTKEEREKEERERNEREHRHH